MHGPDLEDRLVERLRRLPDTLAEPARDDRLRQAIRRGRARLLVRRSAAMTAILGLLAGAVVVRAEVLDRTRLRQVAGPGPTVAALTRGSWRAMAPAPIVDRRGAAAAWTGRELLVWGGVTGDDAVPSAPRLRADGAAYDPAADAWRPLPPAPIAARERAVATWTGKELLIWGGVRYASAPAAGSPTSVQHLVDGAAYDPAADTWRRLPSPLVGRLTLDDWTSVTEGAWTGRELLLVGTTGPSGVGTAGARLAGAAYDPARHTWRPVRASPVIGGGAGGRVLRTAQAWTGSELLVVADSVTVSASASASADRLGASQTAAGTAPSRVEATPPIRRTVLAYEPVADRWSAKRLAATPFGVGGSVWTGSELLTVGLAPTWRAVPPDVPVLELLPGPGRRLDPAGGEPRRMAPGPLDAVPAPILLWTGRALLGVPVAKGAPSGDAVVWDPAGNRWHPLPPPPHRLAGDRLTAVWTGRQLLLWGGDGARATPGLVYTVG